MNCVSTKLVRATSKTEYLVSVSGLPLVYAFVSAGYERGGELPAQRTSNRR